MTLAGIKEGDVVQADVRGDRFYAVVSEKDRGELLVHPIPGNGRSGVRLLTARQVIAHWRRAAGSRA